MAAADRDPDARRGRRLPGPSGLVPDRQPLDTAGAPGAARSHAGPSAWGRAPAVVLVFAVTGAAVLLARRNIRLGRGDRRGAFRLAVSSSLCLALGGPGPSARTTCRRARGSRWCSWRGSGRSGPGRGRDLALLPRSGAVRPSAPPVDAHLRTCLLNGGVRDAVVGRDVLIGMTWGAVISLVYIPAGTSSPRSSGAPSGSRKPVSARMPSSERGCV